MFAQNIPFYRLYRYKVKLEKLKVTVSRSAEKNLVTLSMDRWTVDTAYDLKFLQFALKLIF